MTTIYPKVIIACPIHETKDYCIRTWLRFMATKITYPKYAYHIYLVDNSKNKQWHKRLLAEVEDVYPNVTIEHYAAPARQMYTAAEVIALCQNKIITYCKRQKAQQWFSAEIDNLPQHLNIIERLQKHHVQVVGARYQVQQGYDRTTLIQVHDNEALGAHIVSKPRLITIPEVVSKLRPGLVQVHNLGMGCVLYDMEIFYLPGADGKPIQYHSDKVGKGLSDSFFATDLAYNGIPFFLDPELNCVHWNDSWTYKNTSEALGMG